ncbi:hypothetical protein THER5_2031 [Bifidobacterium thermacidophilum subsp. thermacidophilum]|uniref:Uncharacterized protein n=1 Tax=Bifidobacterium thermacidophilum subsp. thermacidophilum TaxID=79262 RepID=A0A087E2T2_9BIFI|nr:hypothetical protein THER5_2031 [Bifidobacterium thermacidophilum subsp. thermacidophilum]
MTGSMTRSYAFIRRRGCSPRTSAVSLSRALGGVPAAFHEYALSSTTDGSDDGEHEMHSRYPHSCTRTCQVRTTDLSDTSHFDCRSASSPSRTHTPRNRSPDYDEQLPEITRCSGDTLDTPLAMVVFCSCPVV